MSIRGILFGVAFALSPFWASAATFTVTKTADTNDGVCDTDCSLREAVVAANAAAGTDRIVLSPGTYTLTLAGIDQAAAVGDLDLTDNVDIESADASRTVVDGGGALLNDHVFEVTSGVVASLSGVTIRNGGSSLVASGGGLLVAGQLTLRESVMAGCTAVDGGAIALSGANSALTIDKVTLRYNRATGNGGAIALLCATCTATLTNATLSGNRADGGGGGLYQGGAATVTLANATFTGNRADDDDNGVGSGGGFAQAATGTVTLRNSIVAGNVDLSGAAPECAGTAIASLGHNLIGDGTGCTFPATTGDQVGTGGAPVDPLLGPLSCNRSRLDTHALLSGSPALDGGSPAVPGSGGNACALTDERSFLRPWDGDGNQTAVCDIGAFEACSPSFADTTGIFAETQINDMYCRGITAGCSASPLRFCPSNQTTRAEVAVFLIRFAGQAPSTAPFDQHFDDIANNSFAPYINRIFELGITSGCGPRLFCPAGATDRQQAAVFLIRILNESPSTAAFNAYFDDIANNSFAPFINRLFELGISTGCAPRQFCPTAVVTRAQMAVFLAQRPCLEDVAAVAQDDAATVVEDALATAIDVLANDSNPDGGPVAVLSVTQPANGTVAISSGGAGVTYQPNADYCNTPPGTALDTFTYTVTPGGSSATVSVTVSCVDDAPVVTTTGGATAFTEDGGPVVVDAGVAVTDIDSASLASATVTITNLLDAGQETLAANTAGTAITASYAAPTLTLSGSDTLANYQQVLRTVTYDNTANGANTTARSIEFVANDGTSSSAPALKSVTLTGVNDAPVLTAGGTLAYTENDAPSAVDATITVTDSDSANLVGATAQITGNYQTGQDVLSYTTALGITGVFNPTTGTLTLTGTATVANYQTALRNVLYNNTSENPSTLARTVTWQADDGSATNNLSNTPTSTITVAPLNDAPVVTTTGGATAFTEDAGAVVVDSGVTVADVDSSSLVSATVTITNLLDAGLETLAANTAGTSITAAYVAPALTLSGTDTLANYQQVLRTVTYNNSSNGPNATARAISFVASDATASSGPAVKSVTITGVNDAPVVTAGGTLNYTENDAPSAVDTTITVTDVDSASLVGATAQITGNYQTGQDVLSYATALGISGVFNPTTGTLTLTGTASVADYQTALRNVLYNNTSDDPSTLARTVSWQVNDGGAVNNLSNTATSTITVTALNDAPVVTTTGGATTFTEDGGPVAVDSGLTVTDVDSTDLASATVTITNLLNAGQETLAANIAGTSITANYVAPTLTLSGTDTVANYQQVLRSVTYNNASQNPNTTARSIAFVANDGTLASNTATKSVTVTAVNDAPALTAGGTLNYTENAAAAAIDATITVTDVDSTNLVGATVQITGNYSTGDVLSYTTALGITGSFNAGTGTLTLTGTTTLANYQTALRNVQYHSTSDDPSTLVRTVTWQANDGGTVNNLSNTPTSTINVTAVNDPPVAAAVTINAVSGIPIALPSATLNGTDLEAGTTITIDTTPLNVAAGASVTINTNGSLSFIPPGGATGAVVGFQYRVCDDGRPAPGVCGSYVNVTVNLNGPAIHYVKSAAAGTGNCTLTNECTLPTALTQVGANTSRRIFISDNASHTATPTLNDGGWIVGQGVLGADFDTVMGTTAAVAGITTGATIPARPAINAARPTVNGTVTAHNNSNVRGLNVNVAGANQGLVASGRSGIVVSDLGLTAVNGNAVNLTSTSAGFTNFTIAVSGSGGGFVSSGAGTITATQNNSTTVNTISTTTGTALSVTTTTIGASGLTFRRISAGTAATGPATGIVLNNTGTSGGLKVEGTGSAGSGGVIQNTSGGDDDTLTPVGTGIALNKTINVSLNWMTITNHSNYGIRGTEVEGFRLENSLVGGVNGTNVASPFNEGSILFEGTALATGYGLRGSVAFLDNEITGGRQRNVSIDNATGTMNLNFLRNNVHHTHATVGDDGLSIEVEVGAVMFANVSNNTFTAHGGDHFNLSLINSANADLTFKNNDMQGGHTTGLGQGVFVLGASYNGTFKYDISNNGTVADPFVGNKQGAAIFVNKGSGTATFSGQITNNVIGNPAVTGSGSEQAMGIHASARGAGGSHTTLIQNNLVRQYFDRGIVLEAGEGSPSLTATVANNTVSNFADAINSLHGIHCDFGILSADNAQITVDVRANLIANAGNEAAGGVDFRMRTAGLNDTFIAGYSGGNSSANAQAFIDAANPDGTSFSVTQAASGTYNNGPASPLPPPNLPTLPPAP